MLRDYKVRLKDAKSIERLATLWRDAYNADRDWRFDVVDFVQTTLSTELGEKFSIRPFRPGVMHSPAKITFDPLTLHIDERKLRQARLRNHESFEEARHIFAHEIGHMVMHRDQPKAFSPLSFAVRSFYAQEESAEWQANTFARYFLAPNHIVSRLNCIDEIQVMCGVPAELAAEVWRDILTERISQQPPSYICSNCGALTSDASQRCPDCMSVETTYVRT